MIAGFVASCYQIGGGPPWPVDPEIHPQNTTGGSLSLLPFTIRNPSVLFDITNAEFTCGIQSVWVHDAAGSSFVFPGSSFVTGTFTIRARQTVNYSCDPSGYVSIDSDGRLNVGGLATHKPDGGNYAGPLSIDKVCTWVSGEYKLFGIKRRFESAMFQWPAAPGVPQWLEGPTYWEKPNPFNMETLTPLTLTDCPNEPPKVYLRFNKGMLEVVRDGVATPRYPP